MGLIKRLQLIRTCSILSFVCNLAPFNAMSLQVQKQGLTYAASAVGWLARFDRKPKDGARWFGDVGCGSMLLKKSVARAECATIESRGPAIRINVARRLAF